MNKTSYQWLCVPRWYLWDGGFLLLEARSLLSEPFSWTALKRALRKGEIVIEDAGHFLQLERPDVVNARILEYLHERAAARS